MPFVTLGSLLILAGIFTYFVLPSSYNEQPPAIEGQVILFCFYYDRISLDWILVWILLKFHHL